MPFQLDAWIPCSRKRRGVGGGAGPLPSEIAKGRIYGCIFDDLVGLKQRDDVGIDQILFETDYPHSDGTFPHSRKVAHSMFAAVGMNAGVLQGASRQRDRGLRPPALRDHRVSPAVSHQPTGPSTRSR